MPWSVKKGYGKCGSSQWAVVKDDDRTVVACHPTRQAALAQQQALYAAESKRERVVNNFNTFTTMFRRFLGLENPDRFELIPVGRQLKDLEKPSEVSEDAWEILRQTSASKLMQVYQELGETVPEFLYTAAGQPLPTPPEVKERSISVGNIFQKANYAFRESLKDTGEDYWYYQMENIYYDADGLYLVISHNNGQLYRCSLDIGVDGDVAVGQLMPIVEEHRPVTLENDSTERSKLSVFRQKNGKYRIVMRAATAIINRDDEIDSTELFDNMIDHAQETGIYPVIDYFHLGRYGEMFEIGQTDFLARSGVVYIASAELDERKPLTRQLIKKMSAGDTNWGCSIEYYPLQSSKERIGVGANTVVEVYRDGINTRIAILPEEDAAAWFTSVVKERKMNMTQDQLRERLGKVFDNEADLEEFLKTVGMVNEEVVGRNMVFRGQQAETTPEEPVTETPESMPPVLELDDDLVGMIVTRVKEAMHQEQESGLERISQSIAALSAQISGMTEAHQKTVQRLAGLEQRQAVMEGDYTDDLPAVLEERQRVRVTYRATENSQGAGADDPVTFADRAKETLSKIPLR